MHNKICLVNLELLYKAKVIIRTLMQTFGPRTLKTTTLILFFSYKKLLHLNHESRGKREVSYNYQYLGLHSRLRGHSISQMT